MSHSKTSKNKEPQPNQDPQPEMVRPHYGGQSEQQERLGTILRRVREHRNESIEDIAEYLCIRVGYLIALEESEYDKLPADAYVIGFLKTYATYLELDDKGAVNQYRHEMAGRRRKPQLTMPQPMSEGRAPTIALLVGVVCAVLLVYGIWYWLWVPENNITHQEPLLPTETGEVISPEEGEAKAETIPARPPESNSDASDTLSSVMLETTSMPDVSSMGTIVIEAKEADVTDLIHTKKNEKIVQKAGEEPETEIIVDGNTIVPAGSLESLEPLKPRVFGTTKKSYITIKADKDSWVLVTDSKGLTVFDHTLKEGESYRVPRRKGLRLTTGNPKSLSFKIYNKDMPKLATKGKVARGIALSPDKLKDILNGDN